MGDDKVLIQWPVLIRVADDAEMLVVESAATLDNPAWRDESGLFFHQVSDQTKAESSESPELVDSVGKVFSVRVRNDGSIEYLSKDHCYGVSEVVRFVQQHAALQGHCCVSKLGARSIQQAITLVEQLNHE